MSLPGYEAGRWSQGGNYLEGERDPYVCLAQASTEHLEAGYHRRRVGLNRWLPCYMSRERLSTCR